MLTHNKMKTSLLLAGLIFSAGLLFGCQKKAEQAKAAEAIPVRAMKVKLMELSETLDYVGNIKGQDEVLVYPKVSGKIIEKLKEEGAVIVKGEPIAYIDRDETGLKFERAPIESPLSGVIGRIYIDRGSNVLPQAPVAMIVNLDKVKINLDIPEKFLTKTYLGQEAKITVDTYPEEIFLGKVTQISPVVNLDNRAAPVEITLDNKEGRLKSGMFARVSLIIGMRTQIPVILKEAIIGKEPDTYAYFVENNKAVMKKITLGLRQGPYYEVSQGAKEGDLVVIVGQQRLHDNAAVAVEIENGQGDKK